MSDILRPFCSTDPQRPYLHAPWSRDGKTYATNGHILVRVSTREGDRPADKYSPGTEKVFASIDTAAALRPLPRYELPTAGDNDCSRCEGRGHLHDCPACKCECDGCDGSGKAEIENVSVEFCGAILNAKYIRLLQKLPGICIAPNSKMDQPLYFRFDGGDGVLMPMREPMETHIKETESA